MAPGRSRGFRLAPLVAVVLVAMWLTACHGSLAITTDPAMFPEFSRDVFDYVNRCDPSDPTTVEVDAPEGTSVSVDGAEPRSGVFTTESEQQIGQRVVLEITVGDTTTTHTVRCLPEDFPEWSVERAGTPEAAFYTTLVATTPSVFSPAYAAIFDTNGVPVWWLRQKLSSALWTPLANGHFAAIARDAPMQEFDLLGRLVRELGTSAGPVDIHDVLVLPSGNYVLVTAQPAPCDLTAWGEPAESTCLDHVIEELTPEGTVAWSWDTAEHIPITETSERWRQTGRAVYDPWHYNSIEPTEDGFVVSYRNLDAVYRIVQSDGSFAWKIGGSPRTESLQVVDDPVFEGGGSFSGQHDARWSPDGVLSVHDNGSEIRPPRAVAYRIDDDAATATLLEEVTDSRVDSSVCCGSTRRLSGGHWVSGWGGTTTATELAPDGTPVFTLTQPRSLYRFLPFEPGDLDVAELRNGMNFQYAK